MTIYTLSGVPYPEAMQHAMLAKAEGLHRQALRSKRRYLLNLDGTKAYRVEKDRVGAPYKIFREVALYFR